MGNVVNNGVNGKRFATGFPKKPKPPKCRACRILFTEKDTPVRVGGSRYHPSCRSSA